MRRQQTLRASRLALMTLVPVIALTVVGCSPASQTRPSSAPTTQSPAADSSSGSTSTPTRSPTQSGAEARLKGFRAAMQSVWDDSGSVAGRDYVDALIDAGFEKDAMQVTFDETSVGDPADSIQFSVRIGEDCLIGQVGPSVSRPTSLVMPGLSDGSCLLGETRPIDW